MSVIHSMGESLWMSFAMFWEILWPLILGFVAAVLTLRFLRTGGPSMLRMMDAPPKGGGEHQHMAHSHGGTGGH